MNKRDVDFIRRTATLRQTKNGESRSIGLTSHAIQELMKLPTTVNGDFFSVKSTDQFKFYWNQLRRWTGIKKTFHSTRATFATRAAEAGWQHLDIASQTGHKDLNVLKKHYTRLDAQYLASKLKS